MSWCCPQGSEQPGRKSRRRKEAPQKEGTARAAISRTMLIENSRNLFGAQR